MPWEIVFFKENASRSEAMKLEKLIKKRGDERFLDDLKNQSG
jgi:predicted GIY-YIG superfamily endonuclease